MNFEEIEKIIDLFSQKEISKLVLKNGEFELCLENQIKQSHVTSLPLHTSHSSVQTSSEQNIITSSDQNKSKCQEGDFIEAPMIGTFYRCPSPDSAPFVNVGDQVKKGQVIGIVEAMKIMNEIEAEFDCKIVEIIANDAQPIEFGSKLMRVEKF